MTRRLMLVLSIGLLLAAGAAAQEELAVNGGTPEAADRFSVAVFLFADQTYAGTVQPLEAGLRDVIAQTLSLHPGIEVVAPDRLDRAIRRAGYNPARPVPYGAAYRIAKELGAVRAISGSIVQFGPKVRIEAQMAFVEDPGYVWTPQRWVEHSLADCEEAGVSIAKELAAALPVDASQLAPTFWVGSHTRVRVKSTAASATITLANPATEECWMLGGYRILSGKTLGTVAWDPERRQVTIATAEGTAEPDWSVELDGLFAGAAEQLRFSVVATPGARVEIEVTNENLLGQPRTVKTYRLEPDTPAADLLVDGEAVRKDSPLWILQRAFGPYGDSLPLATPATATDATAPAEQPNGPAAGPTI